MHGTPISFVKGTGQRYRSLLDRRDSVRIELDGGGYNAVGGPAGRVPHDLAHFVVEDGLGLPFGLWGVIAAGGLFAHTAAVAGRQPPHAARRGRAVVDRAGPRLAQAELVVRAVADVALAGRPRDVRGLLAALGDHEPPRDLTAERLAATCGRLREAGVRWAALAPGETIDVVWRHPQPRR
jgi:hypothetical protein